MVWLYRLPNSCIVLLFGVFGAALFVAALFLRVKLLRIQVQSDHAKAAHDALAVVIGFVGLILAFSLVQEQNNIRNLEAQVGAEANNLAQLDRLLVRFGGPGDNPLAVTVLVALVFIIDRPFKRGTLSRQPIIKAIAEMQNRASTGR